MLMAALVGAATGAVGGAFRLALRWADLFRDRTIQFSHTHLPLWASWSLPVALCAAGAGLAAWLARRFAPEAAGSGIPRVEAVLRRHARPAGAHILPVKFVGGVLGIGGGLALGREGPTVQMGGTIGRFIGDGLRRIVPEPWTLIAAGAGAGLAVAFNAPLAAALFVTEELLHRFSPRTFSATLVACLSGTVILRLMLGNATDFNVPPVTNVPADVLPEYLLLGVFAGFLGVAFNFFLVVTLDTFDRLSNWPRGARGAIVGAVAGLLAWQVPSLAGGGESIAQHALLGRIPWNLIAGLLIARFALTMVSYGTGAPGGIFAPLLALGALLGNAFAALDVALTGRPFHPSEYAIVAMAACFTAIVRSPLTGVVLLLEMTGRWTLILPMMAASVTAYAVPELLGNPPIYDTLRERDEIAEQRQTKRSG